MTLRPAPHPPHVLDRFDQRCGAGARPRTLSPCNEQLALSVTLVSAHHFAETARGFDLL